MPFLKKPILILYISLIFSSLALNGQNQQLSSEGTWVNNPYWYNPAISGSKDYNTLHFIYATGENYESMVLSGDMRLTKKIDGYYNMPNYFSHSNIGLGYQLFHISSEDVISSGFKATGSYHFKLNENNTSFLSIGLSLHGSRNTVTTTPSIEFPDSTISETSYDPNIDFGIYYYSPSLSIGLSATRILEDILPNDSITYFYEKRNYHFSTAYKFVLYKPLKLLIEPSVIVNISDSIGNDLLNHISPMVKIYIDNFCFGSYLYNKDKISLFFRYNYPGIYLGGFIAISRKSPYYKKIPSIELNAGINLSYNKSKRHRRFHW